MARTPMIGRHRVALDSMLPFPALRSAAIGILDCMPIVKVPVVAFTGSVAHGVADSWSDIDMAIACGSEVSTVRETVLAAVAQHFSVVASYSASHLGLSNIRTLLLEVDDTLVKADLYFVEELGSVPRPMLLSDGSVAKAPTESTEVDVAGLYERIIGWTWYTHQKVERGELFHAVSAVDYSRSKAVIPVLRLRYGLDQVDYRRLEGGLPPEEVQRLKSTYPAKVERASIREALHSLTLYFRDLARGTTVRTAWHEDRLHVVLEHMDRADPMLGGGYPTQPTDD